MKTSSTGVILSAFFLLLLSGCNDSSGSGSEADSGNEASETAEGESGTGGSDSDSDTDEGQHDDQTSDEDPPEPGLELVVAGMTPLEVGSAGDVLIRNMSSLVAINQQGDINFRALMLDASDFSTISGSASYFLIKDGTTEIVPYFSEYLTLPPRPDATMVAGAPGVRWHGVAEDGSVTALMTIEENSTDYGVVVRYQDGDYELLVDWDDIPGLTDYTIRPNLFADASFAQNEAGTMSMLLPVQDSESNNAFTLLTGQPDDLGTVATTGSDTGLVDSEGSSYSFRDLSNPVVLEDGTVSFYARPVTPLVDNERNAITAFWKLEEGGSDPEIDLRARVPFTDQSSGGTFELSNLVPGTQDQGYSINNHGDIALLNGYSDEGTTKRDLWYRDADGLWSIARQGVTAPNLDQVGMSTGGTFARVGAPALSDSGLMAYLAEVDNKTGLWLAERDDTWPVVMAGMSAPGLDNTEFSRIGLDSLPPLIAPLMNNQDQVVFLAELYDSDEDRSFNSLWSYDQCNGLWLIAHPGMEVDVDGVYELTGWDGGNPINEPGPERTRVIERLKAPQFNAGVRATGPNGGTPLQLNDSGEFVFAGRFAGDSTFGNFSEGETGTYNFQRFLMKAQLPACTD